MLQMVSYHTKLSKEIVEELKFHFKTSLMMGQKRTMFFQEDWVNLQMERRVAVTSKI